MPPKLKALLQSRRFYAALAGFVFVITDGLGLNVSQETIYSVLGLIAAWILGDSLKNTESRDDGDSPPKNFPGLVPLVLFAICCGVIGCNSLSKLPPGFKILSQTTGIKVSPAAIDGTPLAIGTHSTAISLPPPADAGPGLNRFQIEAPFGVGLRSTLADGPVGEQLKAAGGPEALRQLLHDGGTTIADDWEPSIDLGEPQAFPLPRTDLEAPDPRRE